MITIERPGPIKSGFGMYRSIWQPALRGTGNYNSIKKFEF
jgi:hypothetical protein